MNKIMTARERRPARRTAATLTALVMASALAGCSYVPNWVNPTTWFEGMFDGSEDVATLPKAPTTAESATSKDKPFPSLGGTPVERRPSSAEDREKLAQSLVADRDNARYTDQNLRAGDQRAAAPRPASPAPVPQAKPPAPASTGSTALEKLPPAPGSTGATALEKLPPAPGSREAPSGSGVASLPPAPKSIPPAPRVVARDSSGLTQVPSIVQRRGSLPAPPAPVTEVARSTIPQVVERSAAAVAGLPKPPTPAPVGLPATPPKLTPSPGQATAVTPPSVTVNLPVGQGQSILAQTYAASLAAQGSTNVQNPIGTFNTPNAAPISGQWPTAVPGVVRQAFNSSLSGTGPTGGTAAPAPAPRAAIIASPQMSNQQIGRLPGAPLTIRFLHGSSRITAKEKKRLGDVVRQAKQQGRTILVVGHASQRTGDMDYAKHKLVNFGISLDRANRVAGELRRQGVAPEQILVEARGDSEPLYFEFMPNGEAKNRRVEIFIR